jgi:superfamily II DNA or RNA helicase
MDPAPTALAPGTRVAARGLTWFVVDRTVYSDCAAVTLRAATPAAPRYRTLLTPFDRVVQADRPPRAQAVGRRRLLHELRLSAHDAHPWGGLRTAARAAFDILPYQLEPALALAAGAVRLLIADAVGLGKTIQTGLALSELAARGESFRALVACPAGLRTQWREELASRFGLEVTFADSRWLADRVRDIPPDVNPWALPGLYVASFDLLKRPEVLRPLEDVVWDALVVDEAHNSSAGTARRAAVHAVARRARRVILLTATPHSGDPADYAALTALGAIAPGDPLVIFRRTRADVGAGPPRRSAFIPVRLNAAERQMHRLLEEYISRVCREAGSRGDSRARLAAIVLQKRALSSAASLHASASRRRVLLAMAQRPSSDQLVLPFADEDPLDDAVEDDLLAAPGFADARQEQIVLDRVVDAAAAAARNESKVGALTRLLRRLREPAIVFTEYRDTLERLADRLDDAGMRVLVLHGGLDPAARAAVQREFNTGGSLLLATDAASEGINLQARCRVVIHFELPWAPGRLEQRAGRVDRIGQRRRVHEILLVARDTAERRVLAPLAAKAGRVRAAHRRSATLDLLTESAIASAILGEEQARAETAHRNNGPGIGDDHPPLASRDDAVREAARLAQLRHDLGGAGRAPIPPRSGRVFVRRSRVGSSRPAVTAVYACELLSPEGRVEHAVIQAVRSVFPFERGPARLHDAARRWRAAHEDVCRLALEEPISSDLAVVAPRYAAAMAALERREAALAAAMPGAAQSLVQPGLFDRRAARAAAARRHAAASLLEASEERVLRLREAMRLRPRTRLLGLIER